MKSVLFLAIVSAIAQAQTHLVTIPDNGPEPTPFLQTSETQKNAWKIGGWANPGPMKTWYFGTPAPSKLTKRYGLARRETFHPAWMIITISLSSSLATIYLTKDAPRTEIQMIRGKPTKTIIIPMGTYGSEKFPLSLWVVTISQLNP